MTRLQTELKEKTDRSDSPSQPLNIEKTRLPDMQSQSEEKTQVECLKQEVNVPPFSLVSLLID